MKERKSDWARKVSLNQPDFFFFNQADIPDGDIIYYVTQPKGFEDPEHPEYLC